MLLNNCSLTQIFSVESSCLHYPFYGNRLSLCPGPQSRPACLWVRPEIVLIPLLCNKFWCHTSPYSDVLLQHRLLHFCPVHQNAPPPGLGWLKVSHCPQVKYPVDCFYLTLWQACVFCRTQWGPLDLNKLSLHWKISNYLAIIMNSLTWRSETQEKNRFPPLVCQYCILLKYLGLSLSVSVSFSLLLLVKSFIKILLSSLFSSHNTWKVHVLFA